MLLWPSVQDTWTYQCTRMCVLFHGYGWRKPFPVISDSQEVLPIVWSESRDVGQDEPETLAVCICQPLCSCMCVCLDLMKAKKKKKAIKLHASCPTEPAEPGAVACFMYMPAWCPSALQRGGEVKGSGSGRSCNCDCERCGFQCEYLHIHLEKLGWWSYYCVANQGPFSGD